MEKVKTYLPLIIGGLVAIAVFIVSRSKKNGEEIDRNSILEKAREAADKTFCEPVWIWKKL